VTTTYELWTRPINGQEWTLSGTYATRTEAHEAGRPATGRPMQYLDIREVETD
jgi:hypothetical protein